MSNLRPGVGYTYRKIDNKTYAREIGTHPGDWFEIGQDYVPDQQDAKFLGRSIDEIAYWVGILYEAEHNPALQDVLDRVKVVYALSKKSASDQEQVMWHPV